MRLALVCLLTCVSLAGCDDQPPAAADAAPAIDASADASVDAIPGTFCPEQPGWVEGAVCATGEEGCALCPDSAACCRHFLVCVFEEWQVLEAGPCEP